MFQMELSGYCGDPTFLNKIADIINDVKKVAKNEGREVLYVCDPVMGDNGRYVSSVFHDLILVVCSEGTLADLP